MSEQEMRQCGGVANRALVVPVQIDGKGSYPLFLDTGAGRTVVSPSVAADLGLEIIGSETRRGVGGEIELKLARTKTLAVDGHEVDHESIGISDVPERLCGDSVVGNLGHDLLQRFSVTIDYGEGAASFRRSALSIGGAIPFHIAAGAKPLILLDVQIGASGPVTFAVDTGAGGTVIAPALAASLGLTEGQRVLCAGVGGSVEGCLAAEPVRVELSSTTEVDIQPLILDMFDMLKAGTGENVVGLIGHDVLSRHRVTIDYLGARLSLE